MESIRNGIERGEYNLIIGDDASGRIPTLIVRKVIDAVYKKRGFMPPRTVFFAGYRVGSYPDSLFQDLKLRLDKFSGTKVLVVTDTVDTGVTLEPLIHALDEMSLRYEILTVGLLSSTVNEKFKGRIHYGMKRLPRIYGQPKISGVVKQSGRLKLFASPSVSGIEGYYAAEDKEHAQRFIRDAREDINTIAHRLAVWFNGTS